MKPAFALFALLLAGSAALAQDAPRLDPANVLSWPRANVDRLGCMLEREFQHRDPRFNCQLTGYVNRGNACTATEAYYEGPEFPEGKAEKALPQAERITLAHEGGRVQSVTVILKQRQTQTAIRALLGLPPSPRAPLPANLTSVDIQGCRTEGSSQVCNVLLLQGFDHVGAGDADCGEEGDRPEPTPQPGAPGQPSKTEKE